MSWLGRILAGDEELGKKNDDHRPLNGAANPSWSARKPLAISRRRRIFYGVCILLLLYVFVKNIPSGLGPASRYAPNGPPNNEGKVLPSDSKGPPTSKPKRPATPSPAEEHYHDGPIKFYKLAASLHGVARLGGQHELNKNILFAASTMKSVAEILPLACQMAQWKRNNVHFAIMGRDEMDIVEIKNVNGITNAEDDCNIYWHDARPDFARWSSDFRMEVSVTASLQHIHSFVHPQVIVVDDPAREDDFFVTAIRSKAMDIGRGIIELPSNAIESMMWLTRLDSGSLAAWTATYVDIMIQAPLESSGSLIRLLKSIENADYFGVRRPHLTIELPTEVDPPTWQYLQNLVWPPLDWSGAPHASQVSLRHRVPRRTLTEREASARLVESFYPIRTGNSHVLLLSPQVELSPLYYHYVMYHLLEYKHSARGASITDFPNLMGLSLELPSYHLNDSEPLKPPLLQRSALNSKDKASSEIPTPFLWQAPNANAALYFGDKWMEFHSFLSARLTKPPSARRKVFSRKHPAWLESLLELIRARGYYMLYPNFPNDGDAIATVHDELYKVPEEYLKSPDKRSPPAADLNIDVDEPLSADEDANPYTSPPYHEHPLLESDLLSLLPNTGVPLDVSDLPLLSYNGINISRKLSHEAAMSFSETFRAEIGTCRNSFEAKERTINGALDLFCHLDEIYDPLEEAARQYDMIQEYDAPQDYDEDMIPTKDQTDAKEEFSAHLARQDDQPLPVRSAPVKSPNQPQKDDSEETQTEFQKQMQRQAKQVHTNLVPEPAKSKPEKTEPSKEKTDEPSREETNKPSEPDAPIAVPASPEPSTSSSTSSVEPSESPQPIHNGFKLQPPPRPVEDPVAEAAEEKKAAGW